MADSNKKSDKKDNNDAGLTDLLSQQPPHNIDIEKALIASLMSIEESFEKVSDIVSQDDFYAGRHQHIFAAISHLAMVGEPYDTVMVHDWLSSQKLLKQAGGESYLADILTQSPGTLFNLTAYAQRVRELSTLRQLITTGNEMLALAYDPRERGVSEILDTVESKIFAINEQHNKRAEQRGPADINSVLANVIEQIDELKNNPDGMIGLQTPFTELNNKTQGLQAGDLIIVAARPSMGKTTFAMNLAEGVLFHENLPVVVFSMEMPAESIVMRLLSSWGQINQTNLRSGQMNEDEWARMMNAVTHLQEKHLYIDDSTALPPSELRSRCRRIAKNHDGRLGLIVVDYLQLMKVPSLSGNRVEEISEISRSLKALARELNCPVIALSQLNRSLENRPNKRPIMSDLRESGAIEQDADLITFIYRDEVYNENSDLKGVAEIIIGKQRNGPIGTVRLAFEGQYTRFINLTPDHFMADAAFEADE
ncbi:replicative DNA helicase [Psychrobacter sp. FDAARGOS_221]|uniref:replicative DNA helicase n=1 Tax=Psychrobacter sp. FDAARGOS_221 TaxID=1975705 RepID=UPI000BB5414A|nr:replicative DNA helicase [Psychrobacter sp. FDAARGOS_221]PNK61670.1 replicative DNA helicase [Psychrobacter sp. FDAARGOS_221]